MTRFYLPALASVVISVAPTMAAPPPAQTLQDSVEILNELAAIPLKSIPASILADAQGVAIIPHVIKAGFVFGGRGGHGVVLARDRNGNWSDPTFINLGGASVGFQAGVQSTDVVLVFRTRKSLDRLLEGKGKVTLGADAAVAAGPVGRQAAAATDARLEAEIVSYSRSRGLFAGVALDGAVIHPDRNTNMMFRPDARPELWKLTGELKARLTEMSGFSPPVAPSRMMMPPPRYLEPPATPMIPVIPVVPVVPVSPVMPGPGRP